MSSCPLPMYACTVGFEVAVANGAPTLMPSAPLKLFAVASASASSTIAVTLTSWPRPSARTILAFEPMYASTVDATVASVTLPPP